MREITTHKVEGLDDGVKISLIEETQKYTALFSDPVNNFRETASIYPEFTNEALLAIVQDRLEATKEVGSEWPWREKLLALQAVGAALSCLRRGTEKRLARAVEGTPAK